MDFSDPRLRGIHDALKMHSEDRKQRARERLPERPQGEWNFAIVGLTNDTPDATSFDNRAEFRKVIEPPGEGELDDALKSPTLVGPVGRYSEIISHELVVRHQFTSDYQVASSFAWQLIAALRVKTQVEFLVPAVADCSWSTMGAFEDNSRDVYLLEDVPQARPLAMPVRLIGEDFRWAFNNVQPLADMLEVAKFKLAVEALTSHQHLVSQRMMAASIWSGIEALMEIDSELRYRLAISAASLLAMRGAKRYDEYRRIKNLYNVRSKAVHGGVLAHDALREHVIQSRDLLSKLICRMIETRKVFSREEIERNVLE